MTKILTPEEYNERSLEYEQRTCEALEKANELYERDLKLDEAEAAKQDEEESDEEDTPAQKAIDDLRRFWQAENIRVALSTVNLKENTIIDQNKEVLASTMQNTVASMFYSFFDDYDSKSYENLLKVLNTKVGRER